MLEMKKQLSHFIVRNCPERIFAMTKDKSLFQQTVRFSKADILRASRDGVPDEAVRRGRNELDSNEIVRPENKVLLCPKFIE